MTTLHPKIERARCIGAGECVLFAADAFEIDETGLSRRRAGYQQASQADILAAAEACPAQCIVVLDSAGVQRYPPLKEGGLWGKVKGWLG